MASQITSESKFRRGLSLLWSTGNETLVHAVVFPLQIENLQRLSVGHHAWMIWQRLAVFHPCNGAPVTIFCQAFQPGLPANVDDLFRWNNICRKNRMSRNSQQLIWGCTSLGTPIKDKPYFGTCCLNISASNGVPTFRLCPSFFVYICQKCYQKVQIQRHYFLNLGDFSHKKTVFNTRLYCNLELLLETRIQVCQVCLLLCHDDTQTAQRKKEMENIPTEMGEAISKFIVRLTSPPSLRAVHRYWPPSSSCKWIQMDTCLVISTQTSLGRRALGSSSRFFKGLKTKASSRFLSSVWCLMMLWHENLHFNYFFIPLPILAVIWCIHNPLSLISCQLVEPSD